MNMNYYCYNQISRYEKSLTLSTLNKEIIKIYHNLLAKRLKIESLQKKEGTDLFKLSEIYDLKKLEQLFCDQRELDVNFHQIETVTQKHQQHGLDIHISNTPKESEELEKSEESENSKKAEESDESEESEESGEPEKPKELERSVEIRGIGR
ncbi:hypothetical protein M0813_08516 [Anaeramoeba flamelloides]|uniref:Uncharacterized protein n=1 Tax=Anaeramoeba flamelloides TaxID=1746091 RepID=A0ABQ8X8L0_9EUKA|nr:hypothetical protein M0813_08516 [Anaeramoeba flamelloides]